MLFFSLYSLVFFIYLGQSFHGVYIGLFCFARPISVVDGTCFVNNSCVLQNWSRDEEIVDIEGDDEELSYINRTGQELSVVSFQSYFSLDLEIFDVLQLCNMGVSVQ